MRKSRIHRTVYFENQILCLSCVHIHVSFHAQPSIKEMTFFETAVRIRITYRVVSKCRPEKSPSGRYLRRFLLSFLYERK